jgi:hypothetical protein
MSTLVLGRNMLAALFAPTFSAGGSDADLRKVLSDAKRELQTAASSAQSLALTSLMRVLEECSQAGWDGYGARAVSDQAAFRTIAFLNALPSSLTPPDIVPEPDGEIAVDWDFGPSLQLSISVGPSGPLPFAGVIGEDYGQPRVRHGTEPFESVVAGDLLGYIHDLHERAGVSSHRRAA